MTEASICTDLRDLWLRLLSGARIMKHHDQSTAGIPDLSINWRGSTTWVEAKLMKPKESLSQFKKHFLDKREALQLASCCLLGRQVPVFYFVAYPVNKELRAVIWRPDALRYFLDADPEVYLWHREIASGTYHQMVEQIAELHEEFACRKPKRRS